MFEVTAKKCSSIWKTEQYKDTSFRENLNKTTNRTTQSTYEPELVDKMRETKYNN